MTTDRRCQASLFAVIVTLASSLPIAVVARSAPDVAGIRLGMTSSAVLETLSSEHMSAKVLFQPCLADYLAQHAKTVSIGGMGHCPMQISAQYDGGTLLVFLTEDVPSRPGTAIVTEIALNYPTDDAATTALMKAAGAPSLTDGNRPWTVAMWCFDFVCRDMNRVMADSPAGRTLLVHRGAGFTLADIHAGQIRCQGRRRSARAARSETRPLTI